MSEERPDYAEQFATLESQVLEGDAEAVKKQHAQGKLTARERIEALLDEGSFVEEFMLAETPSTDFGLDKKRRPTDGVVMGHGLVEGRRVYIFAQDRTVMAGSVGIVHAGKIRYATDTARQLGIPVIGLHDSVGGRIQEGLDVTAAIGGMFFSHVEASGVVPQLSGVMGVSTGVSTYGPALTDFIVMVRGTGQMFITGPRVIKEVLGEEISAEELGGARVHSQVSGVTDLLADDDRHCLEQLRRLLSFLPPNHTERPPRGEAAEDAEQLDDGLGEIVPENMRKGYDIRKVIERLVDRNDFFEVKPDFARNIVIGLGRLDGYPVGFVANQPMFLAGTIDVDAADKATRFIRFCDAFNLPVITLVDVPGFYPGSKQESAGIIRHGARLLYAYAEATVPKLTVYLRKGYGGAKQALCTREMGADQLFVWPGVELAMMGGAGAVNILFRKEIEAADDPEAVRRARVEEYERKFSGPFAAARKSFAHAIIQPAETRRRLIHALHLLQNKPHRPSARKHGLMPV